MAYHHYQTEGFVIGRIDIKESDVLLHLFTKDLGLVHVQAKNLRSVKSKLRYQFRLFAHSHLTLVRGREIWRLIGAEESSLQMATITQKHKYLKTARLFEILRFFVHGQEPAPALFDDLKASFVFLSQLAPEEDSLRYFEYLATLKILKHLGYLPSEPIWNEVVGNDLWSVKTLEQLQGKDKEVLSVINQAYAESGL